jgi:hypothetical protein
VLGGSVETLTQKVQELQAKIDEFRDVYVQENQTTALTLETAPVVVLSPAVPAAVAPEVDRFHDDGGPSVEG